MAHYRLFERNPITGHMDVAAEYECHSDFEAVDRARQHRNGEGMVICDDDLRVVRHFATLVH